MYELSATSKKRTELDAELLRVENLLLFTKMKLKYLPSDYGRALSRLSRRREQIVAMMEGSPDA